VQKAKDGHCSLSIKEAELFWEEKQLLKLCGYAVTYLYVDEESPGEYLISWHYSD
jgi:hypothetical protein